MVQVTDKESALKALDIIVEQGEGSSAEKEAHYQMFLELWKDVDWKCWPVPSSPTTEDYRDSPFLYQVTISSVHCNSCWSSLLPSSFLLTMRPFVTS